MQWIIIKAEKGLTLRVRWMNLALFLGLWGSFEPLMARKSSSFSLLVKAITNLGGHTGGAAASPLPDGDPPFLLSCAVSDEAADLLLSLWVPLLSCAPLSGEAIPLTLPLLWPPLIALEVSEFLSKMNDKKIKNKSKTHIWLLSHMFSFLTVRTWNTTW